MFLQCNFNYKCSLFRFLLLFITQTLLKLNRFIVAITDSFVSATICTYFFTGKFGPEILIFHMFQSSTIYVVPFYLHFPQGFLPENKAQDLAQKRAVYQGGWKNRSTSQLKYNSCEACQYTELLWKNLSYLVSINNQVMFVMQNQIGEDYANTGY